MENMFNLSQFLFGAFGALTIEILGIYKRFNDDPLSIAKSSISMPLYWVLTIFIAIFSGIVTMAYSVESPILAVNIGASIPLILKQLVSVKRDRKKRRRDFEDIYKDIDNDVKSHIIKEIDSIIIKKQEEGKNE